MSHHAEQRLTTNAGRIPLQDRIDVEGANRMEDAEARTIQRKRTPNTARGIPVRGSRCPGEGEEGEDRPKAEHTPATAVRGNGEVKSG